MMPTTQYFSGEDAEKVREHLYSEWDMMFPPDKARPASFSQREDINTKFAVVILWKYLKNKNITDPFRQRQNVPFLSIVCEMYSLTKEVLCFALGSWSKSDEYSTFLENTLLPELVEAYVGEFGGNWKYKIDWKRFNRFLDVSPDFFYTSREGVDEASQNDMPKPVEPNPPNKEEERFEYKGINLQSPNHLRLCKELEAQEFLFWFEAPASIPGYPYGRYKRAEHDLVVSYNGKVLIVEIDGGTHHNEVQRQKDNQRDNLAANKGINTMRVTHQQAKNIEEVIGNIKKRLMTNS